MFCALSNMEQEQFQWWGSKGVGDFLDGWGGIAFIQKKCGIYTTTHWHLYNNTQAFICQHTGIYTTTHWHLYNNTLAFIQHTGIYTTTHWHLYKSCLSSISFPNSSWHSAMNGMWTNKMHAVHGRVLPNFSFSFPNSSWHSAMNGMRNLNACLPWQSAAQFFFFLPKLFMALCHERHAQSKCMPSMAECCPIFLFPSQTLHGTLPWMTCRQIKCVPSMAECCPIFRWFKFTLKPPYTVASGNLLSAIWDTSHWTSFVKFGLKTAWDISYDILLPILKYVNFWWLQGHSSNLSKKDAFRKSIFSQWRSDKALMRLGNFRWAGP